MISIALESYKMLISFISKKMIKKRIAKSESFSNLNLNFFKLILTFFKVKLSLFMIFIFII